MKQQTIDLFSPGFENQKRELYNLQRKIEADVYARDHFINGFEVIAEQNVKQGLQKFSEKESALKLLIANGN